VIWTNFRISVLLTVVGGALAAALSEPDNTTARTFGRAAPALVAEPWTLGLTAAVQLALWTFVERRGDDAARAVAAAFGVVVACAILVSLGRASVGQPGPPAALTIGAAYVALSNLAFAVGGRPR
jgi:hypothetical protein